jgi:ferric-dicitrate binding protein FerR (iron transport regulator)
MAQRHDRIRRRGNQLSSSRDGAGALRGALEIERQTRVHFEFADPEIASLRIGGYISATDVDAFAQPVEQNLGLKVERQSPRLARIVRG